MDDDTAGISVNVDTALETTEGGGGDQFTVVLDTQPMSEVTVALTVGDGTEGSLSAGLLTFTANDWNQPQTVTVSPVDDDVDDGIITYSIDIGATADDPKYDEFDGPSVTVANVDDDTAGITVSPTSGLATDETGGTATFTVALKSETDGGRDHRCGDG